MRDWACDVCADTGEVKQESGGMMPCRACELLTAPMEVVDAALVEMGLDPAEVKAHGDAFVEGLFERRARMAAIRARIASATPGPWRFYHGYIFGKESRVFADMHLEGAAPYGAAPIARARGFGAGNDQDLRNGECIAALHDDVTWLLAEVDRLNAKLGESR